MGDQPQAYGFAARLSIGLAGFLFSAVIAAIFLVDVQLRYNANIEAARKDTANYAEILAEHAALTFGGIDRALHEAESIRQGNSRGNDSQPDAVHWALRHIAQTSPAIVAIGWTDAQGNVVVHSYDRAPPRTDIADMAHFTVQRDHDNVGLYIAPPYRSAVSDRWLSAASRRLSNPDGSFAGIVTAPIDQSYFNQLYRSVDLGKGGSIILLHRGGQILARQPEAPGAIGKSFADGPLLSEYLPRAESGSFEGISIVDGAARILSYKAVPGLPLVIIVTRARADALARWYSFIYEFGALAALMIAGVLFGTWLLLRQTRGLAAQTQALATTAASLEQTNVWLDAALSNMSQGLCLFDADQRLVICNKRFREIYDYPEDLVRTGTPVAKLLEHPSSGLEDSGKTLEQVLEEVSTQRHEIFVTNDGRYISIVRMPVASGGWVATHEDITEQKRSEELVIAKAAELQAFNERFDAALGSMSQGLCLFDAEQRLVICNERFREIYGYPEDLVRPGTPLKTILSDLMARGAKQGDMTVDDYIAGLKTQANETFFNLDGRIISIVRTPTPDGGWVATHEDVTEQKHAARLLADQAAELRTVNARFDAAINNMTQGLCLTDADRRVVMANHRFCEIYGLPEELVQSGVSAAVLIRAIAARGFTPEDMSPEEFERVAPERRSQSVVSADGRTISITRSPIPGGGLIATHEDVTERRSAERRLAENAAALKRANERFEVAINNMPQGVCLFDAEQRVVIANTRYAELYHLVPAQVKAGTSLKQIFEDRRERGTNFVAAPDTYLGGNVPKEQEVLEVADGRIVSISRRLMSDGGWLTTHEDITDRAQSERRIAYLAQHDMLTGLANRALFAEKLEDVSKRHKRHGAGFAVLMLDLDKFKVVNDTLGHSAGDQLLKEVAARLKAALRETDVLARLGGDEFAIIQDGEVEQHQAAITVALRIIEVIGRPFELDGGHQVNIGTSIGIAFAPEHGVEPDEVMKCADLALYAVKAAGRNDFRIFASDLGQAEEAHRANEGELRDAIARGEFELHYQPVFDATTRVICGVEALIRWHHPLRGLLGPDQFIPLAESTGQIVPLGEWVLQQACRDALTLPAHLKVAINLSAVQFRKGNLFDVVLCTLVESGLAPERLELEITEAALLDNHAAQLATMRQLKNLGVAIVLDDFGTGTSSLKHLIDFPFDRIKIDNAFAQGAAKRRDCAAAISSILALARGLDIATTAEGVETEEQADYLRSAGIDSLQGYLLGRPRPLAELDCGGLAGREEMVA